ncbi:hypothetical protein GCM10022221_37910 [Actinocorallia aurea]
MGTGRREHRAHAGVEDRVRTNKAMGLSNLPSKSWQANQERVLAANLDAWARLLCLHDIDDPKDAEPDTLRYRLLHLPAMPASAPWPSAATGPGHKRS